MAVVHAPLHPLDPTCAMHQSAVEGVTVGDAVGLALGESEGLALGDSVGLTVGLLLQQ